MQSEGAPPRHVVPAPLQRTLPRAPASSWALRRPAQSPTLCKSPPTLPSCTSDHPAPTTRDAVGRQTVLLSLGARAGRARVAPSPRWMASRRPPRPFPSLLSCFHTRSIAATGTFLLPPRRWFLTRVARVCQPLLASSRRMNAPRGFVEWTRVHPLPMRNRVYTQLDE